MVLSTKSIVVEKDTDYIYQKASRISVMSQKWKSTW